MKEPRKLITSNSEEYQSEFADRASKELREFLIAWLSDNDIQLKKIQIIVNVEVYKL